MMNIKMGIIFLLLFQTSAWGSVGSCEKQFSDSPLFGSWKLFRVTKDPQGLSYDTSPYPETVVISSNHIEIKLESASKALVYNWNNLNKGTSLKKDMHTQVYDKVPGEKPYELLTESTVDFKGTTLFISLNWTKK